MKQSWKKLACSRKQLQLETTLTGGQSFRWKKINSTLSETSDTEYIGVMGNCLWTLKQTDNHLQYRILGELPYPESDFSVIRLKLPKPEISKSTQSAAGLLYEDKYYENLLKSYFRLDIDLEVYYQDWSAAHSHFKNEANQFYAVRVLDQDPVENLFSFICSQNNHISRISNLVEKLCLNYGTKICKYNDLDYYTFPDVEQLTKPSIENELRNESFGYRAKFIQKSANEIQKKGNLQWFDKLQKLDYTEAHEELIQLTGIGPKVADCICLMSLNHLQAIPVDTHVYQIALQHYLPNLKKVKSITPSVYQEIGNCFRKIYGPYAGWAQTVLFCADLAQFRNSNDQSSSRKKVKLNK